MFLDGFPWVIQAAPMALHRSARRARGEVNALPDEVVRELGLDSVSRQHVRRKVHEIRRDDCVCRNTNRRRENVPVIRIRQGAAWDEFDKPVDDAVDNGGIHLIARPLHAFAGQVGAPRTLLRELARIKSSDVLLPTATTDAGPGNTVRIRRVTTPDKAQKVLLKRLGLRLPQHLRYLEEAAQM